jgi:hypothetical protein
VLLAGARSAARSSAMIWCMFSMPSFGDAVFADAVDPEAAVFWEHVGRQLEERPSLERAATRMAVRALAARRRMW